ncbi:Transferase [Corchorus olitorius]|uniref:Transferase n=1 Tax=Corchorus olitorius TaxID=93759 RepID=A0A1R3GBP4_9ROSI|nr:Transferase [Corchorus olitorius]
MTNNSIMGAQDLWDCLNSCCLLEVKAKGVHYTWSNRRDEQHITWERLDRAFANHVWLQTFENAELQNLAITVSDHSPMILNFDKKSKFRRRPYRFELMWTLHPECKEIIQQAWSIKMPGSAPFKLTRKIQHVREKLKKWNKLVFGDLQNKKEAVERKLAKIQEDIENSNCWDQERTLRKEFESILEQEQLHWMQKSRANWIISGERNTKFFHVATKKRRGKNKIVRIRKPGGPITEDEDEITDEILRYFTDLYGDSSEATLQEMKQVVQGVEMPTLMEKHIQSLNAPFEDDAIKNAVFQMNPFKAPGYDGKRAAFYQKFWRLPLLTSKAWMILLEVFKTQQQNRYVIGMMARNKEGDINILVRSVAARRKSVARLLLTSGEAVQGRGRRGLALHSPYPYYTNHPSCIMHGMWKIEHPINKATTHDQRQKVELMPWDLQNLPVGRLATTEHDDDNTISFYIDCNNAGALFIHAEVDGVTISDIVKPVYVPPIVHSFFPLNGLKNHEGVSNPLLGVQVIELVDGVFVGYTINHFVADGTSFWHFFNSWSEISRGSIQYLSKLPIFQRSFLNGIDYPIRFSRLYVKESFNHDHTFVLPPLKERFFHFSKESIAKLKAQANVEVGTNKISSLQALLSHFWQSVARNKKLEPDEEAKELKDKKVGEITLKMNKMIVAQIEEEFRRGLESWIAIPKLITGATMRSNFMAISFSPWFNIYGNDFGWGSPIAVRSGSTNNF